MSNDKNINERPTFAQAIQVAIEARLFDVHTCLPATVTEYDSDTQKASVQPQLKREYRNGDIVDIPVIRDVPVIWPRGGGAFLHMPMESGDTVTLVFSERSIDEWKESGESVLPAENRKFHLSDAFAIPGGYPFSKPAEVNGSDVQMHFGNSKMKMTKGGKYNFEGASDELMDLLVQTLDTLSTTTTNTLLGPMMLNDFAKFKTLKQKLEAMKA